MCRHLYLSLFCNAAAYLEFMRVRDLEVHTEQTLAELDERRRRCDLYPTKHMITGWDNGPLVQLHCCSIDCTLTTPTPR